jgi:hypothetical protein
MTSRLAVAIWLIGLASAGVSAHGPQIQIGISNSQIITHGLFLDEPYQAATPAQRVYEIPLAQRALSDANDGWYAQPNAAYSFTGPGIALLDGNFVTGSVLSLAFTDGLKIWNGSGFVDPGTEQIDAYRGATHTAGAVTTDAGPFNSYSFTAVAGTADEHKTAFWRLLGDGLSPNTASDDGVYLLSLRLVTDQNGIAASAPYYFLLNKNASTVDESAALSYVNANLVPEPVAGILIAIGGLVATSRRYPLTGVRG